MGYLNNGDFMEEEIIKVVVKECDSNRDDFPRKDSLEGEKMIETIKTEAATKENSENKKNND